MLRDIEIIERNRTLKGKFSLQTDESTGIDGHAQLISNIWYIDGDIITSNLFFCKELSEQANGNEIFRASEKFLHEIGLQWKGCISVCADGASLMTGKVRAFVAKGREVNPEIRFDHRLFYREAIVLKCWPGF
jgi:hypothetical protein